MARIVFYPICVLTFVCTMFSAEVVAQRGPVDYYDCTGKPDGNYVHPSDCTKFIACVAGVYAFEMDCVSGLHYDPIHDRCDWPNVVGCIIDPPATTITSPATTTRPAVTSSTTATSTTTNPPIFDCSGLPDGNYKHPTDCSKFISCVAGEYEHEMECPAGLHYNPRTDQCDYPELAGCDPNTSTSTPSTTVFSSTVTASTGTPSETTPIPSTFNCSGLPDGNYKHPTDCGKYISCIAGQYAYEMDCPEGLHYDPKTDQCDYPEVVGCDTSNSTTSTTQTNTSGQTETITSVSPSSTTATSPSPTNFTTTTADPDACDHDCQYVGIDCHSYYTCINFTRKEYHECSYELGLAFNPNLLVCDRIENVQECEGTTTTEIPTTPEVECGCEYRPHETDCSKYYFCSDSCRKSSCKVMSCPGHLLWSVDLYGDGSSHQQCTLPDRATCASKDSGTAHLEFSCYRKENGLYRNQHNCHSFWKCDDGVALLYACPRAFIYNPEIKLCDFPGKSLRFCTNDDL